MIMVMASLFILAGCTREPKYLFMPKWPPAVNPLEGWKCWVIDDEFRPATYDSNGKLIRQARPAKHAPLDQAIKDDYKNYLKTNYGYIASAHTTEFFYEDGTGRHAVDVGEVLVSNNDLTTTSIRIILIYDKANKRTKVLKYYNNTYWHN